MKSSVVMLLITAFFVPSSMADEMRPGKWQITSKSEMTGMPVQMPSNTHTVTICVDNKNKDRPPIGADDSCKFSNLKKSGATTSWKMVCSGQTKMSGEGSMTLNSDSYEGSSTMLMDLGGGEQMKMKTSYKGKRLGDC